MSQELRSRRLFAVAAIAVVAAVLGTLAYGNIGENLVYYWGPTELLDAGDDAVGASIRLGGLVVPGSIVRSADSLDLRFRVTDGTSTIPVYASAVPPTSNNTKQHYQTKNTKPNDQTINTQPTVQNPNYQHTITNTHTHTTNKQTNMNTKLQPQTKQ